MTSIVDDFRNAFRKQNNGLVQIILINVVVFLLLVTCLLIFKISMGREQGGAFYTDFIARNLFLPGDAMNFLFRPWTLLTYFFSHEGPIHLLFNMLFLYWFGKLIEEYLGNRRLVNLYLLGGFAGGITYLLMCNLVPYFAGLRGTYLLGASGGVFAVVVGAATLMPNYTFFLLLIGPVRIKYIAAFYVILSYVGLATGGNAGGDLAHLGGALMGFLFISQLNRGTDLGRPLTRFAEWLRGLFVRKPKMKVTYRTTAPATTAKSSATANYSGTPDDDEVDAILDKINRSGYESLTKEEKQKLFRASQKN
ncbi:MAG: rhomboid family intramembrane serine protease [Cytophagales bacterium]|nr:rhomboid family intramembrane serine protease [Cytophagales bacterium]